MAVKIKYPRVYISAAVHARVQKIAKRLNKDMKDLGNKIVLAGLKALRY